MDFVAVLPEVILLSIACIILMIDAFWPKRRFFSTYMLVQFTIIAAFFAALPQFQTDPSAIIALSKNYIVDDLGVTSKLFIYTFSIFALLYARELDRWQSTVHIPADGAPGRVAGRLGQMPNRKQI